MDVNKEFENTKVVIRIH